MFSSAKNNTRFCLITASLLVLTVVLGRIISVFQSVSATDIAYADWVSNLMAYIGELIVCARAVLSYTAAACAVYYLNRSAAVCAVLLAAGAALLDYAARFLIDLLSSSLTGMEILALIWLLLQLLYELIFLALAVLIAVMMKKKADTSASPYTARKYTVIRAIRCAVLLLLLSHIALEAYYLVDFLLTYTGITNTEIASIIGQFLKILVIYGGGALLLAEGFSAMYAKAGVLPANSVPEQ